MVSVKLGLFDADSIEAAAKRLEGLAEQVEEKSEQMVEALCFSADMVIEANSPRGFSGDYKAANHVELDGCKAVLWNDVKAITPYDDSPYNPLELRMGDDDYWVGESYASAVEYGADAGWELWKKREPYAPYTMAAEEVRNDIPDMKAMFTLD